MYRHLIAGTLACFGSSLLAQTNTNPASQPQGALNNAQNTLQSGIQNNQDPLNKNVQPSSGTNVTGNGQNRSSLNTQGQVNGSSGLSGNVGIPNTNTTGTDNNTGSNFNLQQGQSGFNQSTQVQGQQAQGVQRVGDNAGQQSNVWRGENYQTNGSQGFQSSQRQGQAIQQGQSQYQNANSENGSYSGGMQGQQRGQAYGSMSEQNLQQAQQSQNMGQVYMLRYDATGREYICVGGRPIYFDNVNSVSTQENSGTQNQYRSGYGNYDQKNSRSQYPQVDQRRSGSQFSGSPKSSIDEGSNWQSNNATNSRRTNDDAGRTTRDNEGRNWNDQNDSNGTQNERERKSDADVRSTPSSSNDLSVEPKEPKA